MVWFTNGNLETNDGDSIAEGIGQGRVTKNIEGIKVDRAYRIPDQTGLTIVYQLLREEGLFLGLSSGINVAGAVRFAKESGPGQTIVTILCDSGHKYQSTLFNRDWLASNHLNPELPLESVLDALFFNRESRKVDRLLPKADSTQTIQRLGNAFHLHSHGESGTA